LSVGIFLGVSAANTPLILRTVATVYPAFARGCNQRAQVDRQCVEFKSQRKVVTFYPEVPHIPAGSALGAHLDRYDNKTQI